MTITRWSPFREIDRWEFAKGIEKSDTEHRRQVKIDVVEA